jgi:hypothetical protein
MSFDTCKILKENNDHNNRDEFKTKNCTKHTIRDFIRSKTLIVNPQSLLIPIAQEQNRQSRNHLLEI